MSGNGIVNEYWWSRQIGRYMAKRRREKKKCIKNGGKWEGGKCRI